MKTGYLLVFGSLLLTVFGQIVLKWRIQKYGQLPEEIFDKFLFLFKLILDPFVLSSFISAFGAAICWMAAMTKLEITRAYPIMSLAPALVFVFGIFILGESFTWGKILGLGFVILGVIITIKI